MGIKTASSIFEEALFKQRQQESQHRFTLELVLLLAILFGSFMVGVNNLTYNTLFLDEAINAVVGEDVLQGVFTRNAVSFHFGSYLYPALAALLNKAGGVTAMRLGSTFLICLASAFVYLLSKQLFGLKAGLFALILFSFSGIIVNLEQMAVYDSLALPLLAGSFFFLIMGTKAQDRPKYWFLAASVCAALSILAKYLGLLYLPALFLSSLTLMSLRGTSLRRSAYLLSKYFLFPALMILSLYASHYLFALLQVLEVQGFTAASRIMILSVIWETMGLVLLLALAGLIFFAVTIFAGPENTFTWSSPFVPSIRDWKQLNGSAKALAILTPLLLLLTWLAAPLLQFMTGNIHSLWKSCAYSLIFLAPMAGYGLAYGVERLRSSGQVKNLAGVACLCLGTIYFANQMLNANQVFHRSWPNTGGAINYLKESGLNPNSRVLAEDMDVYEYYFDFGTNDRQVWNSFWYMQYGGKTGQEGAFAAIRDRVPDFVILDDYYLPGLRQRLEPVLLESGYQIGWEETQKLHSGETILVQVYVPGKRGSE